MLVKMQHNHPAITYFITMLRKKKVKFRFYLLLIKFATVIQCPDDFFGSVRFNDFT